jgi:hypothetical protein
MLNVEVADASEKAAFGGLGLAQTLRIEKYARIAR